ncbi:GNAT family N-acetyltransferase [Longimicrobium sp.]|uniref:GNAT family N-acetyltransferase n=1 Tax=Longimicrobium sp. TaxID=2029185 RepID=UPI002E342655|nr:GNAT family N-acetyltransferase [Longimicrobium sp.]HEX6040347.1 GNAT family N-acetyltransferase [Longimicrobium sp.]
MIREFGPDDAERMEDFDAVRERAGYPTADEPVQPSARCLVASMDGDPVARLSLAVADDLHGAPGRTGLIGHYERTDADAARTLLRDAVDRLRGMGVARILGPINGSTWGRYRLALPPEPGEPAEPPFLSEPTNPADYPADFEAVGFRVAAAYESAIVDDLSEPDPRRDELAERVRARGAVIRPLDLDRFDDELRALHALSLTAFAGNLFYSPISFDEFRARYTPLRPLLDPELVRMSEDADGRLLGFVFAFPDLLTARDGRPTRVVLKTLASAPAARGLGLGTFLTDEVRRLAHEKGYASVIHALMQADNASIRISRHSARVFRRYALYAYGDG